LQGGANAGLLQVPARPVPKGSHLMELADLASRFAVALGIGLLFGLERGWRSRDEEPGQRTAGIRTFAITGLLGGAIGAIAAAFGRDGAAGGVVVGIGFASYAAVIALFAREENRAEDVFSATTAIAGMLTFALGAYALLGDIHVAAAAAVAAAVILAVREGLHGWVAKITWEELRAGLVLMTMTFIALPLLPDRAIGPFGGVNPREIWLIAIVLAAVSFFGYAVVKVIGTTRGILIAAAAGGLVSSTAVMVDMARKSVTAESSARILAAGATLATAISIARTLVIIAALNPPMLAAVSLPLAAAAAAAAGAALMLAFRHAREKDRPNAAPLRNPFDLRVALGFALFLGIMELASRALAEQFGGAGAIVAALAAGVGDVDAVVISMAKLAPATLQLRDAALAAMVAVVANTIAKLGIGGAAGSRAFALYVAAATAVALIAGLAGWVAVARLGSGA
jgi:uncharacterized membrane protein (DUF4010 family)